MFVVLFGLIGGMRGWARELLVTSAVVLGLFLTAILESYISPYKAAARMAPTHGAFSTVCWRNPGSRSRASRAHRPEL
jgi:hypothetical protein